MTPEETRAAAKVMLDWADWADGIGGKKVQVISRRYEHEMKAELIDSPNWNWLLFKFEPVPEPTYREYTEQECRKLVGEVVVYGGFERLALHFWEHPLNYGVYLSGLGDVTKANLVAHGTIDGKPCGVEVQG